MSWRSTGGEADIPTIQPNRRLVKTATVAASLLCLVSCSGERAATPAAGSQAAVIAPSLLADLFGSLSGAAPLPQGAVDLIASAREDPSWPMLTYLVGEAQLRSGAAAAARSTFKTLVVWAMTNHPAGPYGDTLGGDGLAPVALWRWLGLLQQQERPDADEVSAALIAATSLQDTRLYGGMVRPGLLPALPALEEDIADRLAHLAWTERRPEADSLFLQFLAIHSSDDLDLVDREQYADLVKRGLVTAERLDLFRARRMLGLSWPAARKDRAADILRRLWSDPMVPADIRAEAGYEWANYRRLQSDRRELVDVLTRIVGLATDPSLAEKALFARAMVHNRGSGRDDTEAFRADMTDLLTRFPRGRLADDALNQLAAAHFYAGELDDALEYYQRLRAFDGANDFQDSAYYVPALILFARNGEGDLDEADRLLDSYAASDPNAVFRLNALFWRGRIAERKADQDGARRAFEEVVADAPYEYFGLRARMHLESGAQAMGAAVPAPNSRTRADIHDSYRRSVVGRDMVARSPYHDRLRTAVAAGLYPQLLDRLERVGGRLDDVPLAQLDADGLIPATALLLSIRQDAMAARDSDPSPDNWLRLAGFVGRDAGDWTVALEITASPRGVDAAKRLAALVNDPRYLATAYPDLEALHVLRQPLASGKWPIQDSGSLSQALMYAVIRQESRFYPRAISQVGALGLFQFMPRTFRGLDQRWRLLGSSGVPSETDYLFDPARNVALWARWVTAEFNPSRRDEIADVLMKHQAGSGNVRRWDEFWNSLGTSADLEYRIETARFQETRNFVRWTLRDTAIADAAGLFENQPGP